jgi:hippurate hydrolase
MPSRVVGLRRWFHQHAELSFQEHDTAAFIAEQLKTIGIDVQEGVGRTGVVGLLVGGLRGPCIGIRADMDALPIQETTGLEFASKNAGVMHACGILVLSPRVLNVPRT